MLCGETLGKAVYDYRVNGIDGSEVAQKKVVAPEKVSVRIVKDGTCEWTKQRIKNRKRNVGWRRKWKDY